MSRVAPHVTRTSPPDARTPCPLRDKARDRCVEMRIPIVRVASPAFCAIRFGVCYLLVPNFLIEAFGLED